MILWSLANQTVKRKWGRNDPEGACHRRREPAMFNARFSQPLAPRPEWVDMPDRLKRKFLILLLLAPVGGGAYLAGWLVWGLYHINAAHSAIARRDFPQARQHLACCRRAWPSDPETLLLASQTAR